MNVEMICGCTLVEPKRDYVKHDQEGFMICANHGQRRKGWRSIPASTNHPGQKHLYFALTPLEVEARYIFKEAFPTRSLDIKPTTVDRRDLRDSEQLGRELLDARSRIAAKVGDGIPLHLVYDKGEY